MLAVLLLLLIDVYILINTGKKTETQISVQTSSVNKDIVIVECKKSRGIPFQQFAFEVRQGLPIVIDNVEDYNNSPF